MDKEIALKRKLVEVADAVRKKFKQIKAAQKHYDSGLEKFYNPITKPVTSIYNLINHQKQQQQQQQAVTKPVKVLKKHTRSASAGPTLGIQKSLEYTPLPLSPKTPTTSIDTSAVEYPVTPFDTPSPSLKSTSPLTTTVSPTSAITNPQLVHTFLFELHNKPSKYDTVYGVRYGRKEHKDRKYIGNLEVRFPEGKVALYKNSKKVAVFNGSPQLYELLFLKYPSSLGKEGEIDASILKTYGDILKLTNAVYDNYDPSKDFKVTRWKKFSQIIQPLMTGAKLGAAIRKNSVKQIKLPEKMHLSSNSPEYIYWNKPKELVDRLRLLWSSKLAGHTGHNNEIMSIIEELREEGIIY